MKAYNTKNLPGGKYKQGAAPACPTRLLLLTQLLAAVVSFSTWCTTPVDAVGRVKISVSLTSFNGDLLTFDDEESTSFEADPRVMTVDELQQKVFHAHKAQMERRAGGPTEFERYVTSYGFDGYKKMLSLWYDRGNPAARQDGTLGLGMVKLGPAYQWSLAHDPPVTSSATLTSAEGLQLLNYRVLHGRWPDHLQLHAIFVDTLWEQCSGRVPRCKRVRVRVLDLARSLLAEVENPGSYRRNPACEQAMGRTGYWKNYLRLMLLEQAEREVEHYYNEDDLFAAYGPWDDPHIAYSPRVPGSILKELTEPPSILSERARRMEAAPPRVKYAVAHCWIAAVTTALLEKEEREAGQHKPRPLVPSSAAMAEAQRKEAQLQELLKNKLGPVFSVDHTLPSITF